MRAASVLLALALGGCSGCGDEANGNAAASASAARAAALAPVPAPEALLADVFVRAPDETWRALRDLIGFPATALPSSSGLMAGTLIGLSGSVAGSISGDVPMVGALVDDPKSESRISGVAGMHVRSGSELVASLTKGSAAAYTARRDAPSGVTLLEPIKGKAPEDVALGVVGNYLLAARRSDLVLAFGPYVARTLPKAEIPPEPVAVIAKKKALSGAVTKLVRDSWASYKKTLEGKDQKNRALHGGRAPDFGDPAAAMLGVDGMVERLAAVLQSSEAARLVIVPGRQHVEARLTLAPVAGGEAETLVRDLEVGDLSALLALPRRTLLGVASRTSEKGRADAAKASSTGLVKLFSDRLSPDDKKKLEATLDSLAAARGDDISYGLLATPSPAAVLRTPASSATEFTNAAKGAFNLLRVRAFAEPLRQFVGDVDVKQASVKIEGLPGNVRRAVVTIKPAPMRLATGKADLVNLAPKPIEFMWTIRDGVAYGAAALDAAPVLVDIATASTDPKATLAADAAVAASAKRIGGGVSFAVMVQPVALGMTGGPFGGKAPSSPLLVAVGRSEKRGWVRVDIEKQAFGALVRQAAQ